MEILETLLGWGGFVRRFVLGWLGGVAAGDPLAMALLFALAVLALWWAYGILRHRAYIRR